MTLIVAWQRGDDAYILGDSVVTTPGLHATEQETSFGQPQQLDECAVEEGAIKIWQVAPEVIVGVAGCVAKARSFLEIVRRELTAGRTLEGVLDTHAAAVREEGDQRFQLIFAYRHEGRTQMVRMDSASDCCEDGHIWIIGTQDARLRALVVDRIEEIGGSDDPRSTPDFVLAAAIASLSALNVTEYLTASFVGGAFFGGRVSASGVHWQDDLAMLLYTPLLFDGRQRFVVHNDSAGLERIFTCVRGNAGIVYSSIISDRGRLLPPPWPHLRATEWQQLAREAFPSQRVTFEDTKMFAFIAKACPHVTILKRRPRSDNPLLFVDERVEIEPWFLEHLRTSPTQEFRIRCVVDPSS